MSGRKLVVAALVVALAQIGFLSWIILSRAAVLREGKEVLLKVEPIDPRDLLRGDYVRLNYEIRDVPVDIVTNAPSEEFLTEEAPVFVRLSKGEDGYWRPDSASLGQPASSPQAGEVDIRGTVSKGWRIKPGGSLNVKYGIDRYYVPEGEGRAIEADMRERPFAILAAVGRDGTAQIKALMDGQTILYAEPPY